MPRAKPDPAFAMAVRRLREQKSVAREAMAFDANITTGSLARIELGQSSPTWNTVCQLAGALELSLAELAAEVEATVSARQLQSLGAVGARNPYGCIEGRQRLRRNEASAPLGGPLGTEAQHAST
jgi:transcriptional regulator with XRE-family HTH domain